MLVGAVLALVLVAVLAVGGYVYAHSTGTTDASKLERVVLIFESPAEDGATVAALVTIVSNGKLTDVAPDKKVTIPGTTAGLLRDAYVFGGGGGVARALGEGDEGGPTAFVAVPPSTWATAVDDAGGVSVNVPQALTVFNGSELITIRPGAQKLSAKQVAALLDAQGYLPPEQAGVLRAELAAQMVSVMASSPPAAAQLESDLDSDAVSTWVRTRFPQVVNGQ